MPNFPVCASRAMIDQVTHRSLENRHSGQINVRRTKTPIASKPLIAGPRTCAAAPNTILVVVDWTAYRGFVFGSSTAALSAATQPRVVSLLTEVRHVLRQRNLLFFKI